MKIGIIRLNNKDTPGTEIIEGADILSVSFFLGDDIINVGIRDGNLDIWTMAGPMSILPKESNCVQMKRVAD